MSSIQERIEAAVVDKLRDFNQTPSKVYLGKREARSYNKSFQVISRTPTMTYTKGSKIVKVYTTGAQLEVVYTKHKSYFSVR